MMIFAKEYDPDPGFGPFGETCQEKKRVPKEGILMCMGRGIDLILFDSKYFHSLVKFITFDKCLNLIKNLLLFR